MKNTLGQLLVVDVELPQWVASGQKDTSVVPLSTPESRRSAPCHFPPPGCFAPIVAVLVA
jgi:hypothetical protein